MLIEVLVGLAVVAVTLAAIGAVVANNVRGARAIEDRVALAGAAETLLAALPARSELRPGTTTGDLAGIRWRIDVAPLPAGAGDAAGRWVPLGVVLRAETRNGTAIEVNTARLAARTGG